MKNEDIINQLKENRLEHNKFMDKLDELKEDINEVNLNIATLPEKLKKEFDDRYASKEYEDALKKINWILISTIVGALLILVINN